LIVYNQEVEQSVVDLGLFQRRLHQRLTLHVAERLDG
jgi:hypothetical protein